MAIVDKNKVQQYLPKNNGVIHAVQWTGKADCLVGLPDLNQVVIAIEGIDRTGQMRITCTGDEDVTHVRPFKDYVVIDGFGNLVVWTEEFLKKEYNLVEKTLIPSGPVIRKLSSEDMDAGYVSFEQSLEKRGFGRVDENASRRQGETE